MDDVSLRKAIESRDDNYIKSIIRPKIRSRDMCLCMIGANTHKSRKWIPWEITLAIEEKKNVIAMRFKNMDNTLTHRVLIDNSIVPFNWDVDKLFRKISD
ncbi:MAG: TIR domain-containing protein [Bacteroidota bacterium]|nr:TIR domain-containing protein [Bacteroidota bacterium]